MRFTRNLVNSLALAMSLLQMITAEDSCASETLQLKIYTKSCNGLSVKTKINDDIMFTACGNAEDGIDGFRIVGQVSIAQDKILEPTKFWFNQGPSDDPHHNETECILSMKEKPCVTDLVWKIGYGLDYTGGGQSGNYNLKGGDSLSLTCEGDIEGIWNAVP